MPTNPLAKNSWLCQYAYYKISMAIVAPKTASVAARKIIKPVRRNAVRP
jgi:hypothetical protein